MFSNQHFGSNLFVNSFYWRSGGQTGRQRNSEDESPIAESIRRTGCRPVGPASCHPSVQSDLGYILTSDLAAQPQLSFPNS